MRFMVFRYDDYYCHGIQSSFEGFASSLETAKDIRGERYENQNLEVIDTDTGEIHVFRWRPTYRYESKGYYVQENADGKLIPISFEQYRNQKSTSSVKSKQWLVSRHVKDGEIPEIIQDQDDNFEKFEQLGYWSTDIEDYDY